MSRPPNQANNQGKQMPNKNQSQNQKPNDNNNLSQSISKQNSVIESPKKQMENNPQSQNTQPIYPVRPYLERNLVPIVQQGLIELDKVRPDDPLEFLGNYLISKSQGNK